MGVGGKPENWTSGAQVLFQDENKNLYMGTLSSSNKGVIKSVIVPTSQGAPKEPFGKLTIVNASTGETSAGRVEREVGTADTKAWNTERAKYLDGALQATDSLVGINRMVDLLDKVSTSGYSSSVVKPVSDFFGVTPANVGEFNNLTADFALQKLKLMGANPTEGERAFILQSAADLRQSGASNAAILKNMAKAFNKIAKRGTWLLNNPQATRDDFYSFSIDAAKTKKTVNIRDLKK